MAEDSQDLFRSTEVEIVGLSLVASPLNYVCHWYQGYQLIKQLDAQVTNQKPALADRCSQRRKSYQRYQRKVRIASLVTSGLSVHPDCFRFLGVCRPLIRITALSFYENHKVFNEGLRAVTQRA